MLSQPKVPVFLRADTSSNVKVARRYLINAVDLAYDKGTHRLYALCVYPKEYRLYAWTNSGRRMAPVRLPKGRWELSILWKCSGRVRVLAWMDGGRTLAVAAIPRTGTGQGKWRPISGDLLSLDRQLLPERTRRILRMLSLAQYLINVRPVTGDCVAWSTNVGTVSFGTRFMVPTTVVRSTSEQRVHSQSIHRTLWGALAHAVKDKHDLRLMSISVSRDLAAYGLKYQANQETSYYTTWLDLRKPGWPAIRVRDGVLARTIEAY
jgi:hypothetical protein